MTDLRVFPDARSLYAALAESFASQMTRAIDARGECVVAVCGGRSVQPLYELLATEYRDRVDWSRVHLYWVDERYVPRDDDASNYALVKRLLIDRVPMDAGNVHPMPTDEPDPARAAGRYDAEVRALLERRDRAFDVVLLALGSDGHIASLFPRSASVNERERLVLAVEGPQPHPVRLTLTPPALSSTHRIHVFVVGAEKAGALRGTLDREGDAASYPARALRDAGGGVVWWADEPAAPAT